MNYDYSLIKTSNEEGRLKLNPHAFFAANDPPEPLPGLSPGWLLELLDFICEQPFSNERAELARKLIGDVFTSGLAGGLLPDAFAQEVERLIGPNYQRQPFSEERLAKILDTIRRGYARSKEGDTTYFAVHSMVRSRLNRTQRAQAAQHARFKQHVGSDQRRLLRNRPMLLSESDLTRDRNELLEQQRAGLLEVRTLDGRLVDLETLQIAPALPAENPRPSPILDSLANDIPAGIPFPKLPGGAILSPNQVQQVVEGMASIDGELQVDPKDGSALVVPAGSQEAPLPEGLLEEPFEPALENPENEELALDEEELEELPPGVPPPPAPAGGMPPRPQHGGNKNKHKNRR